VIHELGAHELLAGYRDRSLSPLEVVDALLERIAALDGELGAFNTLCAERARDEARAAERAFRDGSAAGVLAGVPIAVKDLFDSAGVRTTYGSPMFADHVPRSDAAAVGRVREAGAIMLGKTQIHEFAWGITSVNEALGTARNPWRRERISGGSTGGSAVALAARFVPLALGSDTGGSIRVPAAFCGTVGLKPTFGRVPTDGVWPLAPSLDHVGPMARSPADAALLLSVMDGRGSEREHRPVGTVGVCPDLHVVPPTPAVQRAFDAAVAAVEGLGVRIEEVRFRDAETIYPTFAAIQLAEALYAHRRAGLFPERSAQYGADVRRRLEAAEDVSLPDYLQAAAHRERLRAAFGALFDEVDLLLTPVAAGSPVPIGENRTMHRGSEIGFRELIMPYTVPQDLFGLPACAVRAGFDELGIPIAVQFTGRPWEDQRTTAAAQALFEATRALQERWPVG
jgi:aspartyl-tRNA(Asn)/glutamyl-tRNA(Gln) amidotransferase subunit A